MRAEINIERIAAAAAYVSNGRVDRFGWASKSARTWLIYESALRQFREWCTEKGHEPLPASTDTLKAFLEHLASTGRSVATSDLYLAAVACQHRFCGHEVNRIALADMRKGIRRIYGAPQREARPLLGTELQAILALLDPTRLADVRDGAVLALGWSFAGRRSEIVGLDWRRKGSGTGSIRDTDLGLVITLAKSKTSQDKPVEAPVPAKDMPAAVTWLRRWVAMANVAPGQPLFRAVDQKGRTGKKRLDGSSVARIIKKRMRAHTLARGALPEEAEEAALASSGHSLRAGLVTSAARANVPNWKIQARSRHKSAAMVARYTRAAESWNDNALTSIGF